ncbi:MAG: hypothetical protein EOM14_16270 [Clostridia bacterium]|nr:hypothetical protein [Clostridia bacterium]
MEHINFKQVMGSSQNGENVLGKFLYFSLSNILIEKEQKYIDIIKERLEQNYRRINENKLF